MRLPLEPTVRGRPPLAIAILLVVLAGQLLLTEGSGLAVAYLAVLAFAPARWILPLAGACSVLAFVPPLAGPRHLATQLIGGGIALLAIWVTALLMRGLWLLRARIEQVVEESPVAMLMVDAEGRILTVNRATLQLLGYAREELVGRDVEALVPAGLRGRHVRDRTAFLDQPSARPMGSGRDLHVLHRDGHEVPVEIGLNPIRTSEGTCVLASVIDNSERQRFIEALEARNRELQDFAFVASHDLREPLRKVIAYGDILRDDFGDVLPEPALDIVGRMGAASTRMQALIDGLLEYSRIGSDEFTFERVDLNALLDDVLSDLELLVRERGVRIERDRLPTIWGHPTRLRQLFQNLIANGIKFQSGDCEPRVQVRCNPEGEDRFAISVIDNGVGFPQKKADRLFRPFTRLHGASEFQGTGMGLAIGARIASRHGWRLTARSSPGRGSCFTLHLGISESRRGNHDIRRERGHAAGGRR